MTTGTKTNLLSTAAILLLLLTAPVFCQDPQIDPLAFTPTGDALWDRYAQTWLDLLAKGEIELYSNEALPPYLLASWEAEFGDDPRYWQLCAWNAHSARWKWDERTDQLEEILYSVEMGKVGARGYLEEAKRRGASDATIEMLLYDYRRWALDDLQDQYFDLPPDGRKLAGVPEFENKYGVLPWFMEQEFALADALVEACPKESWAWYSRAMKQFEYAMWEEGLEDMRVGNSAPNNRLPLPFPVSFILDQIGQGKDCGSPVAAGGVWSPLVSWPLPNYIKIKDNLKNQQVRCSMGAPLSELEPWHLFACRFGSMENAPLIHSLVGLVISDMWGKYLLVQTPESLDVYQREAMWRYYGMSRKVKEIVKYEFHEVEPGVEGMTLAMEEVYLKYGMTLDLSQIEQNIELMENIGPQFELDMLAAHLGFQYDSLVAEYGEISNQVKQRFEILSTFDATTFSWPD